MKKILLLSLFLFVSFANAEMRLVSDLSHFEGGIMTYDISHYEYFENDEKVLPPMMGGNRTMACMGTTYQRVCIDGKTQREICKVMANGVIAVVTVGKSSATSALAGVGASYTMNILCEYFTAEACRDFLVCNRWQ